MKILLIMMGLSLILGHCKARNSGDSSVLDKRDSKNGTWLTIVGFNDLHGNVIKKRHQVDTHTTWLGGYPATKAYLDIAKDKSENFFVVDSGDGYAGTAIADYSKGRAVLAALKGFGVKAATLGNHAFDHGLISEERTDPRGVLKKILREGGKMGVRFLNANMYLMGTDELVKAVNTTFSKSEKPVTVTSNGVRVTVHNGKVLKVQKYNRESGKKRLVAGYWPNVVKSQIFPVNGLKVGVVGAVTTTTVTQGDPKTTVGLGFVPIGTAIPKEIRSLRKRGANVVILVSHAGGSCDMSVPAGQGCKSLIEDDADEMYLLVKQITEEANKNLDRAEEIYESLPDAVFAGHVHSMQAHTIRAKRNERCSLRNRCVPVVQTTGYGKSFSTIRLRLEPRGKNGKLRMVRHNVLPPTYVCHEHFVGYPSCSPDAQMPAPKGLKRIGDEKKRRPKYLGRTVNWVEGGETPVSNFFTIPEVGDLVKTKLSTLPDWLIKNRFAESDLSNCMIDLMQVGWETKEGSKIDGVMYHSGGIRETLPKGQLTKNDVYDVMPFASSRLGRLDFTRQELEKFGMQLSADGPKSIAVVSRGWKVAVYDPEQKSKATGKAYPNHKAFKPPQEKKLYRIVTDSYNISVLGKKFPEQFAKMQNEGRVEVKTADVYRPREMVAGAMKKLGNNLPPSCKGELKNTGNRRMVKVAFSGE